MQELVDIRADAEIPGVAKVQDIHVNMGGRQGGTETPNMWNWLLEYLFRDEVEKWSSSGYGFQFDNGPL
eukprot:3787098-Karenia_brevis.AAC.1